MAVRMIQTLRKLPWLPLLWLIWIVWLIGQIVRDLTLTTALMFYVPTPLVLFLAVADLLLNTRRASSRFRKLSSWIVICSTLLVVLLVENRWVNAESVRGQNVGSREWKLVHWNLGHPVARWAKQQQLLMSLQADLIVLSEVSSAVEDSDFPDYNIVRRGNLLFAVRKTGETADSPNSKQSGAMVTSTGSLIPGGVVQAYAVRCDVGGSRLCILMADHTSRITIHRDPWLNKLMQTAGDISADVIVGDLNAPRRSLALQRQSSQWRHAYDVVGHGWSYTWPAPLPVFAIDQCICGNRIRPVDYELQTTLLSDHRIQILTFEMENH